MKFGIGKKIRFGYFSAFILLVISYLLLFSTTDKMLNQTKWESNAKRNIHHLEVLISTLKDVENGYSGYLLMNKAEFINLFNNSISKVDSSLKDMGILFNKDSSQIKKINNLQLSIKDELFTLKNGLFVFAAAGNIFTDSVKNVSYNATKKMEAIRQQVVALQVDQQGMLYQKDPDFERSPHAVKVINFTSMIIAVIIAIYSLITYTRENKARRKADEQALLYRKQLEQRMEELNTANTELSELKSIEKFAATGRMARMIAHEVRNPLTNIGLANDQLKDAIDPNEENYMLLDMIKRNGERINHLVGNLLSATRFVELNRVEFSVNDLLDDVLLLAKDRIELNDIKIERSYAGDIYKVFVDAEKIRIAFLNIIVNAIEAVEPGKGIIQIKTLTVNKMCRVIIKDNGVGMNEESLSKLFEPFFTSKNNGNGLGLTNAQNIILNHKGNINVDSMPGKGTSFNIGLHFA
jgi:signal transduction histidine kinase